MKNIEIVSVNYCTADLTERLIESLNKHEGLMPIRIIDGSDKMPYKQEIREVCNKYSNVTLEQKGYNIHHGGGMNAALLSSQYDWMLIIDSDCYLNEPFLTHLHFSHFFEGFPCWVNQHGVNVPDGQGIMYIHPEIQLVDVKKYKSSPYSFIKHGAPSIEIMSHIPNTDKLCMPEELRSLYTRTGRGTVSRFGYQL